MKTKAAALALTLLLPALGAASDLNPGALQLKGSTNFAWQKQSLKTGATTVDTTTLGGGLSAVYYVTHFLGFGLAADYLQTKSGDFTRSEALFGPKAAIDWELVEHLSLFGDLTLGITRGTIDDVGFSDTGTGFGYEIAAGFKIFLNRNVSLDFFGAWQQLKVDFPSAPHETTSNLTFGTALSVYLTNNPANSERNTFREPPPERHGEYR